MTQKVFIVLALVLTVASAACSKRYENQINAGGLNIMLRADRYPLAIGDNQLVVIIIGPAQRTITDAAVEARFSMPVPGAASTGPGNKGVLKGDKYFFTVTPTSKGIGKLDLTVRQPDRQAVTTSFSLDVR